MYVDFIKDDADLASHYATFESNILIDDSEKLSKNFTAIEAANKDLGNTVIHIVYGTSVGIQGQLLKKLSKRLVNISDLDSIYTQYSPGDTFVFCESGIEIDRYKPKGVSTFIDLLKKILAHTKADKCVEISLKKNAASSSYGKKSTTPKSASAKSVAKKTGFGKPRLTYNDDKKLELAVYYLKHDTGLSAAEEAVLGYNNNGTTAKDWLNKCFGIDTSSGSKHKGLLISSNIDNEIAKAAPGIFKTTLEKIKKQKLI